MRRTFLLHWIGGDTEEVSGSGGSQIEALANACNNAGYGGGAMQALDYWEEKKDGKVCGGMCEPMCADCNRRADEAASDRYL